nr:hypothetical protein [Candidatus Moranbacteria bacterium]
MKKNRNLLSFFLFLTLAIFLYVGFFNLALAAEEKSGGIVPCGKGDSDPCTLCHLIIGIQNLVNWGTGILVTLAILGIVIAGIIYIISTGNEKMMSSAKSALRASLVGFAVFLAAWLIVNSVIYWILSAKSDLGVGASGGWSQFKCDTSSSALKNGDDDDDDDDDKNGDPDKLAECNKWCNDNKATGD